MSSKVVGRLDGIRDFDVLIVDVQDRDHRVGDCRVRNIRGCAPDLPPKVSATCSEVLSRHVLFEIESIYRLYFNLYVPKLQRVGRVVEFLTRHRGFRDCLHGARRTDE